MLKIGLFKPKCLSIDLGTVNTLIYLNGELVLNEPSVVAIRDEPGSLEKIVVAVGKEAKNMLGRTPGAIQAIRPMKDGVIADFSITKKMLQYFIRQVMKQGFFSPSPSILICVPCGSTQVERRAIKESAVEAGAKEVFLIDEPIAAALGAGMDISVSAGNMVVDIGGGTTEIGIMSLNGIVYADSVRVAGDAFNESIAKYVRRKHQVIIGEVTAEKIKEEVGSAYKSSAIKKAKYVGRGVTTGLPTEFIMTNGQALDALKEPLTAIIGAIRVALEQTPPELSSDIAESGVMLTGGGALLEGLSELIKTKTNLDVHIADNPLICVAHGANMALEMINRQQMAFVSAE